MARKYTWKDKEGAWADPVRYVKYVLVARRKIKRGEGPFVLSQDGVDITGELSRGDVLSKLNAEITKDVGPIFRVRNGSRKVVLTARAVTVKLDKVVDSTSGNENADFFYNWVVNNYSEYDPRYAGAYVCKVVAGTSTPSQHSYGNAVDFFFDTIAHQEKVALEAVEVHDFLHLRHVISLDRIWTKDVGWKPYTGVKHYHVHADFDPAYSGPCGVKP